MKRKKLRNKLINYFFYLSINIYKDKMFNIFKKKVIDNPPAYNEREEIKLARRVELEIIFSLKNSYTFINDEGINNSIDFFREKTEKILKNFIDVLSSSEKIDNSGQFKFIHDVEIFPFEEYEHNDMIKYKKELYLELLPVIISNGIICDDKYKHVFMHYFMDTNPEITYFLPHKAQRYKYNKISFKYDQNRWTLNFIWEP